MYHRTSNLRLAVLPVVILIWAFVGVLFSCRKSSPNEIALVLKTLSNPFFVQMQQGAQEEANTSKSITLLVQATRVETDTAEQNQLVDNLLTRGIKILCITPDDSKGAVAAVVKANRKNVPVVVIDTKLDKGELDRQGAKIASFIGSDNKKGGALAAGVIAEALGGHGNVALIEGAPGQETAVARSEGFLQELRRYPGIRLVARQTAYWEREKGYSVGQAVLSANPDLTAIFACNDEMALGVSQAAKDLQRKLVIVGFDYTPDGKAAIDRGDLYASIAQAPAQMGRLAVRTSMEILNGKPVSSFQPVPVEVKRKTSQHAGL
jgi:ribose transport system substrate-binding protein